MIKELHFLFSSTLAMAQLSFAGNRAIDGCIINDESWAKQAEIEEDSKFG